MIEQIDVNEAAQTCSAGQIETRKWPVLHYGVVPTVDLQRWRFEITGAVERPLSISWSELLDLPRQNTQCDIHCVTRWSRYDNEFEGVPVQELLKRAGPRPKPATSWCMPSRDTRPTCRSPI